MIQHEIILKFINNFLNHSNEASTRNLFMNGYCYYFAHMLKTAFGNGEGYWYSYNHFK